MQDRTPVGLFHPFYLGETTGDTNELNVYHSNLIANPKQNVYIVEGQKDVLAM